MKYILAFALGGAVALIICAYILFGMIAPHPSKIHVIGASRADAINVLSERCLTKWRGEKGVFVIQYSAVPTAYHSKKEALEDKNLMNSDLWIVNRVGGRFPHVSNWQVLGFDKNTSDNGNTVSSESRLTAHKVRNTAKYR